MENIPPPPPEPRDPLLTVFLVIGIACAFLGLMGAPALAWVTIGILGLLASIAIAAIIGGVILNRDSAGKPARSSHTKAEPDDR